MRGRSDRISLHNFPLWRIVLEVVVVGIFYGISSLVRLEVFFLAVIVSSRKSLGPSLCIGNCGKWSVSLSSSLTQIGLSNLVQ